MIGLTRLMILGMLVAMAAACSGPSNAELAQAELDAGLAASAAGDGASAVQHYQTCLTYEPANKYCLYNLGVHAGIDGRMTDAENYYRTALSIDPNFTSPIYNLAVLTRDRGDNLQAADLFRRYVALVPDDALGHYNLGIVLLNLGQTDEAMRELAEAQRIQPDLTIPTVAPSTSPAPSASAAPPTQTPRTSP